MNKIPNKRAVKTLLLFLVFFSEMLLANKMTAYSGLPNSDQDNSISLSRYITDTLTEEDNAVLLNWVLENRGAWDLRKRVDQVLVYQVPFGRFSVGKDQTQAKFDTPDLFDERIEEILIKHLKSLQAQVLTVNPADFLAGPFVAHIVGFVYEAGLFATFSGFPWHRDPLFRQAITQLDSEEGFRECYLEYATKAQMEQGVKKIFPARNNCTAYIDARSGYHRVKPTLLKPQRPRYFDEHKKVKRIVLSVGMNPPGVASYPVDSL